MGALPKQKPGHVLVRGFKRDRLLLGLDFFQRRERFVVTAAFLPGQNTGAVGAFANDMEPALILVSLWGFAKAIPHPKGGS
jgi:hypothetical protein